MTMTTNTATPIGFMTNVFTRPSMWSTIVFATAILTVGVLCAVAVLYRRVKSYRGSLDQVHAKIDTLLRLTENDEKIVDEPLPVEESPPQPQEADTEDVPVYHIVSESEDEDDHPQDDDNIPRIEELPPPVPIPTKKPRRKSSAKGKATVMDLDAVMEADTTTGAP